MSFIRQINECETKIKDNIEDKLSFIRCVTWTYNWTKCPSYLSSQIIATLANFFSKHPIINNLSMSKEIVLIGICNIALNIDNMSMLRAEFTINPSIIDTHMDKVSMMKIYTWTYSGTKCPSSFAKYSHDLGATWTSTWTKCPSSFAKYNMQVEQLVIANHKVL